MIVTELPDGKKWFEIEPKDAVDISLAYEIAPLNEAGYRCPWPWDPQQLVGAPLGQYHCPYCLGMQVAGLPHLDLSDDPDSQMEEGFAIATLLCTFFGHWEWRDRWENSNTLGGSC